VDPEAASRLKIITLNRNVNGKGKNIMKSTLRMALFISLVVAVSGAVVAQDATKIPRGVHLQSRQMHPELVKKTQEETTKAIKRAVMEGSAPG
jgi:hypothetical protein